MKKLILCISMMLACGLVSNAQSVVKEGMTFKSVTKSSKAKADTLLTDYKFQDSKGLLYPIIINKQSGRCWIWKKSGKTGRMYKQYMKEDVSRAVCKELGVIYIAKKK